MRLTSKLLAQYVGGQVEIQNQIEGYIFRGEIAEASVEGEELRIRWAWFAKGKDYPLPQRWVREDRLEYGLSLVEGFTAISDIGPSAGGGGNRLAINSVVSDEMIIFFPPDGSKLDPSRIEEPEISTAQ